MTLGEFARSIAEEIAECAEWKADVRAVIGSAAELLDGLPGSQMKWFWQEVAAQLTARRPIEHNEFAERITAALDAVLGELTARGLEQ